jgi:hypothetical protein
VFDLLLEEVGDDLQANLGAQRFDLGLCVEDDLQPRQLGLQEDGSFGRFYAGLGQQTPVFNFPRDIPAFLGPAKGDARRDTNESSRIRPSQLAISWWRRWSAD